MNDFSSEDAAAYAHEMRGALTVIAGYAELLRRPLDDQAREAALDGIARAIRRADGLCADALAGRALSTRPPTTFELVSLGLLAEQVARDLRYATRRAIKVSVSGSPEVLGDPDALTCAVRNVIDNAAKYSLTDSSIEVRVARQSSDTGEIAVLEVADRGSGIPEKDVSRVLQPFTRLDRDADLPGTGLGLGIAQNVVEAHGGTLSILPRAGGGTVVRLAFPQD